MSAADQLHALLAHEFDIYLEQRYEYRRLVAEGNHRGVPAPVRPIDPRKRAKTSASAVRTTRPSSEASVAAEAAVARGMIYRRCGHVIGVR
jgi:hypothetical protein